MNSALDCVRMVKLEFKMKAKELILGIFLIVRIARATWEGENRNSLVLATRLDIRRILFNDQGNIQAVSLVTRPPRHGGFIDVDYDATTELLYMSHIDGINRFRLDSSGFEVLEYSGGGSNDIFEAICVDWVAQNMYYHNAEKDHIVVKSLTGLRVIFVVVKDVEDIRGIQVDPVNGYLFWGDWGKGLIERSLLDGTERRILAKEGVLWVNDLALDLVYKRVYWVDAKANTLEVMDYDGGNRRIIMKAPGSHFFSLTIMGNYTYLTDWRKNAVERVNRFTGEERVSILSQINQPFGIASLMSPIHTDDTNECDVRTSECEGLCIYRPPPLIPLCITDTESTELVTSSDTEISLVLGTRNDILRFWLKEQGGAHEVINPIGIEDKGKSPQTEFQCVDYDPTTGFLYVSSSNGIQRLRLDGSDFEILVTAENPKNDLGSFAVDWLSQNLYYHHAGEKTLNVRSLRQPRKSFVIANGADFVRGIRVDPVAGYLFWSDNAAIKRSFLDGTGTKILMDTSGDWPGDLALDRENQKVYWGNSWSDTIDVMDYNGGNNKKVVTHTALHGSHIFSIAIMDDHLYWTNWIGNVLERANRFTGENVETFHNATSLPFGIVFLTPNIQTNDTNECDVRNSECQGLCFYRPPPHQTVCWDDVKHIANTTATEESTTTERPSSKPDPNKVLLYGTQEGLGVISLNARQPANIYYLPIPDNIPCFLDYLHDTSTVYYSLVENPLSAIIKLPLGQTDSSDATPFTVLHRDIEKQFPPILDKGGNIEGVAVDWIAHNIYWVHPYTGTIGVFQLCGTPSIEIVTGLREPRAIVLDPTNGYMYWSDWGEPASIERAFLDGTGREVIVKKGLGYPNGLALDRTMGKLYWADAKMDRIEVCNLDGSDRRAVITEGLRHVFGLAILGDDIFWSDWISNKVMSANRHTGQDVKLLTNTKDMTYGLLAVDLNAPQEGTNICGVNNGGCSHFCFYHPTSSNVTHVCACPDGLVLDEDMRRRCFSIRSDDGANFPGSSCRETVDTTVSGSVNTTLDAGNSTDGIFSNTTTNPAAPEFNETHLSFNETQFINITDPNLNATGPTFNITELHFNETSADFNDTNGVLNTTQTGLDDVGSIINKTTSDFDKGPDANFNNIDSNWNETGSGSNNMTNIDTPGMGGVNGTHSSFNSTDILGSSGTTSTTVSTDRPDSMGKNVAKTVCPCNHPRNIGEILDHFCRKETTFVLRATVKAVYGAGLAKTIYFRRRKKVYKNEDSPLTKRELSHLKARLVVDESCWCSDIIRKGEDFFMMGYLDQGVMNVVYIQTAKGSGFRTVVRGLETKDDPCVHHAWHTMEEQMERLISMMKKSAIK